MHKLFFDIQYEGLIPLLLHCLVLILSAGMLSYLLFFIFSKILFRKKHHHKDHALRLTRLWSMVVLMLFISLYFFLLIKQVGISALHWSQKATLLGILPFAIIYLLIIVTFLIDYNNYRNKIVSTKII